MKRPAPATDSPAAVMESTRIGRREWWAVWLGSVGLVAIWFVAQYRQFLASFSRTIPGDVSFHGTVVAPSFWGGDHIQVFYLAWKLRRTLLSHWSIFSDPFSYASNQGRLWDLVVGPHYWCIALLSTAFGPVVGYNLGFVVLPLIVGLAGTYFMLAQATRSIWIRSLGAIAFSIIPMRWLQLVGGHGGGAVAALLPWYWGAVLKHRRSTDSRFGDLVAGAVLIAIVLGDDHQGFYTLLTSAVVFATWLAQDVATRKSSVWQQLLRWKGLLASLLVVLAWALTERALQMVDAHGANRLLRPIGEIRSYSHPLSFFLAGEGAIGGFTMRALPIAALSWLILTPGRWRSALRSPYLGFALALPLSISLLVGIGDDYSQRSGVYEWFYRHVPLFSTQRVPGKMFSVVGCFVVLLLAALYESFRWREAVDRFARAASVLIFGVLIAQPLQHIVYLHREWPGLKLSDMTWGSPGIFQFMRSHLSQHDIVLNVPFNVRKGRYETIPLYLAYQTRARMADGYFGADPPPYLVPDVQTLMTFNSGTVSTQNLRVAQLHGYSFILLDLNHWPLAGTGAEVRAAFDQSESLERISCEDEFCLYRFR